MKLTPLKATAEQIDLKKGFLVTYSTDVETKGPGLIVLNNPDGIYSVYVVNMVHMGGPVKVLVKGFMSGSKKPEVNDIVAHLLEF